MVGIEGSLHGAVSRGDAVLFMCQGCQGNPGSWMMIFAPSVDRLYDEIASRTTTR